MRKVFKIARLLRALCCTLFAKLLIGSHQGNLFTGSYCRLTKNTNVGNNVNFNGMRIYGRGQVIIGDNFHSGFGCEILTENHNYEGCTIPYDDTYSIKNVSIGDNVWFGHRVILLPGIKIGEGVIIQAGSVVVSDIPDCAIVGGHPARVFSYRNKEHYYLLKEQGRTH